MFTSHSILRIFNQTYKIMASEKHHILVVEDETEVAAIVGDYLKNAYYSVELVHTGGGVVDMVRKSPPDLILLDIMLPEVDGVEICRQIREFSQIPIIMLTAKVDEIDRLLGYDLGADDYICKPVNPREILARVTAVLRRHNFVPINDKDLLVMDDASLLAVFKGKRLDLTATEYRMLKLLYSKEGKILSRTQIKNKIYSGPSDASDRAVDTCIKKLRNKMSQVSDGDIPIRSVYGLGYKFERNDYVLPS